jgi:hypothetical protein
VLTALARIFVEAVFASYRSRARRDGIEDPQCGSVNFVQRFGSLNLHAHFHLLALDGVFARDAQGRAVFHPAEALDTIVARTARRSIAWLRSVAVAKGVRETKGRGERARAARLPQKLPSYGTLPFTLEQPSKVSTGPLLDRRHGVTLPRSAPRLKTRDTDLSPGHRRNARSPGSNATRPDSPPAETAPRSTTTHPAHQTSTTPFPTETRT